MKFRYMIGLCLCMAVICWNCYDDKGNYDYRDSEEVMPVKIDSLDESYSLDVLDSLKLTPHITGMDAEENYLFTWYLNSSYDSYKNTRDTVALTRNLDVAFDCEAGNYTLIYEIRDKRTDLYVNKKINLEFASDFAHGWYVVKDVNGETDIDFVYPDSTVRNDVFSRINGHKLKGEALKMEYQASFYRHEVTDPDGTVSVLKVPALFVFSKEDLSVLNATDLTVYKNYDDFFYDIPQRRTPQNFMRVGGRDLALINGGQLYLLYGMASNVGKMSLPMVGNYDLADGMVGHQAKGMMVFDRNSRSFLYSNGFNTTSLVKFPDKKDGSWAVSANGLDADLIALLSRNTPSRNPSLAYALMQKRNREEYYLADIRFDGGYPFTSFDTLSNSYQVAKADVFAAHQVASCIYFASGSTLKAHIVSRDNSLPVSVREKELKSFPDETISYIAHIKSASPKDKFENLVVLTNSASGWKLYRFALKGSTFEIEPEPVAVYKGEGTARYAMFRV